MTVQPTPRSARESENTNLQQTAFPPTVQYLTLLQSLGTPGYLLVRLARRAGHERRASTTTELPSKVSRVTRPASSCPRTTKAPSILF